MGTAVSAFAGGDAERPGKVASVVRPDPRTGRLVRSVVATRPHRQTSAAPAADLTKTVAKIAEQNQLSPQLIHSVIQVESNYDPYAVSAKGALGIMQLVPATARRFGVSNVFDAESNIAGGARYLKYLLDMYDGNDALALAAYNAGEQAVSHYGGIPPYPETRNYVAAVRKRLGKTPARETAARAVAVQTVEVKADGSGPAEMHRPIREVMDADGKIYYISR